ncbi:sigma-70 RNA polymerase sigma factor region 4 domain-containing protein [Jeotgalibacillus campisalis]|uniref:Uncharacterized protein n=1 Tax=Jeotgalibacillus campisalis TaxID=220754 RepID=A0A0C2VHX4_9BACL|nr:sigma-70 family RNA polymerase sigma factor [Jeotgalibacillus campisalis]KIL44096.1 hypothetical protein KR50_31540 [Jeotgalibacillus campisalis]
MSNEEERRIQKEIAKIEQFLLQLGAPERERKNLLRTVFSNDDLPSDDPSLFLRAFNSYKEREEPEPADFEHERIFPYPEDQELHEAIHNLPLIDRTVWVLTNFHSQDHSSIAKIIKESRESVAERQEEARKKLHNLLTDGENGLSEAQLEKSMNFLIAAYAKLEMTETIETIKASDSEELIEKEQKHEPIAASRFKWAGPASVGLIFLLISLAFMLPAFEPGTGTENEAQEEEKEEEPELTRIPEEEIVELEEKLAEKLESLGNKTGLSEEELDQISYVHHINSVITEARAVNEKDEYDEYESDFVHHFGGYKEYITNELKTPMEFLEEEIANIDKIDYGPDSFSFSDMIVSSLLYRSIGFENMYSKKLTMLHHDYAKKNGADLNPSSTSVPEDITLLQEKIKENGFDYAYNAEAQRFDVFLGRVLVHEKLELLDPVYQTYLKERPELPYVINDELQMPFEDVPEELTKVEDLLIEVKNAQDAEGTPWLFDELAMEHEKLLTHFVYGYEKNANFEDGRLKEEVQKAWEKMIQPEKLEKYESAAVIKEQYDELAKRDFKQPEKWNQSNRIFDLSYTQQQNNLQVQPALIPLEGGRRTAFKEYQKNHDLALLKDLTPEEIALFYFQAIESEDPETVYSLLANTQERPTKDEFFEMATPEKLAAIDVDTILYQVSYFEDDDQHTLFFESVNGNTWLVDLASQNGINKIVYNRYDFY